MPTAFESPAWLIAAMPLAVVTAIVIWRNRSFPRLAKILVTLATALLALATGQPHVQRAGDPDDIAVMVDLSASTRNATYRDTKALNQRLAELLGDRPHRVVTFDGQLLEPPSDARVVIAFTDGQVPLPAVAPSAFCVVDPALDRPADARVTSLDVRDEIARATVVNSGPTRTMNWGGGTGPKLETLATGSYSLSTPVTNGDRFIGVLIDNADAWPENDTMTTVAPPPVSLEQWWIGDAAPSQPWTHIPPTSLSADLNALLQAGVIVLQNVPADALTTQQRAALDAYVRQAGGTLVLLGGDRAFAAGGYVGTALDALSPLASYPPTPTVEWTVLTDASGSMASAAPSGGTRFDAAVGAVRAIVAGLPPNDTVTVGSFARDVRWWSTGRPASETSPNGLPPAGIQPNGPTNLAAAMDAFTSLGSTSKSRHVILLTDGGADALDVPAVTERLKATSSTLNVLSIGTGPATASLQQIASATGGTVVSETDPALWQRAASRLLRAAGSAWIERSPVHMRFSDALAPLGEIAITPPWNRTWPRANATIVGTSTVNDPMAAWWSVGAGRAIALAFDGNASLVDGIVQRLARPPRDPRFVVAWADDPTGLRVTIDAVDDNRPINGASLSLNLAGASRTIPQTGPGRYELSTDAPRQPTLATVAHDGQLIARRSLAGHYAPEFAAIGNNYANLRELATRTGGRVVWPNETARLDLPDYSRPASLTPFLAALGAIALSAGLFAWRRG